MHLRMGLRQSAARAAPLIPGITTSASSKWMGALMPLDNLQRLLAVAGLQNAVSGLHQQVARDLLQRFIILDDEDGFVAGAGSRSTSFGRPPPAAPAWTRGK